MGEKTVILALLIISIGFSGAVWLVVSYVNDNREAQFDDYGCEELLLHIQENQAVKYDFPVNKWIAEECWK